MGPPRLPCAFVLESFNDEPVTVQVAVSDPVVTLRNLLTGAVVEKLPPVAPARFSVTIPAHSYMAFSTR